jgi:redox-sensitive bicupin YhaK (pirin superfamily)
MVAWIGGRARNATMLTVRPAGERGHGRFEWLDSRHSFSFADYHDPAWMGFRALCVINEDHVAPGAGFAPHSHHDMEIVTWVLAGVLEHRDSLGNGSQLRPGDVQVMSAGTGIRHSEYNPDADRALHLLQMWVLPERRGMPPWWRERHVPAEARRNRLVTLAAPDDPDALPIGQDVRVLTGLLDAGTAVAHELSPGRHAWLHLARGAADANGRALTAGDGLAVSDERRLAIAAASDAEVILFDLA